MTPDKQSKLIYVIGDLQGCLAALKALLAHIDYHPDTHTLWFTGDLVNRGPHSLETLRFVRDLPSDTITVLGNHDISLLVHAQRPLPASTHALYELYTAPDCADLLDWLRQQPLLHHDSHYGITLTHAGVYPSWSLSQATEYANRLSAALRGPDYPSLLPHLFGNTPFYWDDNLPELDQLRFIVNALTRMRFCEKTAQTHPVLNYDAKGPPDSHPELIPWFEMPNRVMRDQDLIFGHWSSLEANTKCHTPHLYPLDTGCVWGNALTAYCLNTRTYSSIPCKPYL